MKQGIKDVVFYAFLNLVAVAIPFGFAISPLGAGFLNYLQKGCESGGRLCGFFEIIFVMYLLKILQIVSLVIITVYFVKNAKSEFLTRFFNKGYLYILLMILFVAVDVLINNLFGATNGISDYNFYFSLSKNYFWIFLVILLNRLYSKYVVKILKG